MLGTISYAIPTGVVEIEIIDNAFTRRWWPHYKKIEPYLKNSLQVCHRNCVDAHVFQQMKQGYHPERRAELVESIWKLKNCVKVLNKDGYKFPIKINITIEKILAEESHLQKHLNDIHRCFTTADRLRDRWTETSEQVFELDNDEFKRAKFLSIIHDINLCVHEIEYYIPTDRKRQFGDIISYTQFIDPNTYPKHYKDEQFITLTEEDLNLFTLDHVDVTLNDNILGKSYLVAFLDDDDPRCPDITPNQIATGELKIGRDNARTNLFQHRDYTDWFHKHRMNINNHHGCMPIGNIVKGKELLDGKWADFKLS